MSYDFDVSLYINSTRYLIVYLMKLGFKVEFNDRERRTSKLLVREEFLKEIVGQVIDEMYRGTLQPIDFRVYKELTK